VRQRTPFKNLADFNAQLATPAPANAKLDVRSNYFEVRTRLRLLDRVLVERSLLQRLPNGQSNVLMRERVAGLDQVGS
jgi:type II secretory pathway component PulK